MDDELPWIFVLAALAVAAFLWWRSRAAAAPPAVTTAPDGSVQSGGLTLGSDTPATVPVGRLGATNLQAAISQSTVNGAPPNARVPAAAPPSFLLPQVRTGNADVSTPSAAALKAAADHRATFNDNHGYQGFGY